MKRELERTLAMCLTRLFLDASIKPKMPITCFRSGNFITTDATAVGNRSRT
jgi:hypothetical protein